MTDKPRFVGERVRVSDVFDLQMGKTPSRKEPAYWNNGDYEWVSIKDLGTCGKYVSSTRETISELGRKESGIKPVPASTLIMSFKLSLGKTAITTRETYTNEAIMAFVDKGRYPFSLDYMWHQFRSKDWTAGTNAAVMGKTLNKKTLGAATIAVPPIEEQISIARRLDYLQELTGQSECQLALLDALVKSRFVEMFGEPTTRCGRWPLVRLDSFAQVVTGNTPSRKNPEYYGEGIEWVKTDNIVNSAITASAEQLTETGRAKARIAPAGSILMACIAGSVNSIGKVGLLDREAAFNQQINAIVPSCGVNSRFLLTMLTLSKDYLCSDVNQQLKGILNKTALSAKQFPLPPFELQQQFASFVAQIDKSRFVVLNEKISRIQHISRRIAHGYSR